MPLTDSLEARTTNPTGVFGKCGDCAIERTQPYIVGAALEIGIKGAFRLSVDGLYSRANYNRTTNLPSPIPGLDTTYYLDSKHAIDRWEFPVMLKYQLPAARGVRPFVAAGVSALYDRDFELSRINGVYRVEPCLCNGVLVTNIIASVSRQQTDLPVNSAAFGPVFAAGAVFGTGRIRPSIEVRYTRWAGQPIRIASPSGSGSLTLESKQDQVQVLAGLQMTLKDDAPTSRGWGGLFSFGVRAGLPLTSAFTAQHSDTRPFCNECGTERTLPYIIGPSIAIRVAGPFSVSFDALYNRADYNHTSFLDCCFRGRNFVDLKHTVDRWDFPVLLNSTLGRWGIFRPFAGAGVSVQYLRDFEADHWNGSAYHDVFANQVLYTQTRSPVSPTPTTSTALGPTLALGTNFGSRRFIPSVELRYTRWSSPALLIYKPTDATGNLPVVGFPLFPVPRSSVTIQSRQDQFQLLVGFRF